MDPITITALSLAAKYVPDIIGYFKGDKAGEVAGKVLDIAQTVTGTQTPEAATQALSADPEKVLAFQQAVMQDRTELQRLFLADVQNARERDVKLAQAGRRNYRADVMLSLTFLGMVACVGCLLYFKVDANTAVGGALLMLVGKLLGNWSSAFDFEFGSSRGSRDKDESLNKLLTK